MTSNEKKEIFYAMAVAGASTLAAHGAKAVDKYAAALADLAVLRFPVTESQASDNEPSDLTDKE